MWLSKKHNLVKRLNFGSEFSALKLAFEFVIALQYKLRMFGVPLQGPTDMFLFKYTSTPESMLLKKHHRIACHKCSEAVAALICRISEEYTETNLANIFTKIFGPTKR